MDRDRALDNVFIERLWRSVKYEEIYLHEYETVPQAIAGLGRYFKFTTGSDFINRSTTRLRRSFTGLQRESDPQRSTLFSLNFGIHLS
jgi:hypothetical protein